MEFYPEHFLDETGKFVSDKPGFVPYGIGMIFQIQMTFDLIGLIIIIRHEKVPRR